MTTTTGLMLADFAAVLWQPEDLVEFRLLHGQQVKQRWTRAASICELLPPMQKRNIAGWNCYAGANPRIREGGTAEDVALARCLFVDLDGGCDEPEARRRIDEAGLPMPTMILGSGHGTHCYWRLEEPVTDLATWTRHQRALIAQLHGDPSIHDPPRIMRLPGFLNHKPPPAESVLLHVEHEHTYPIDAFRLPPAPPTPKAASAPHNGSIDHRVRAYLDKLPRSMSAGDGRHKVSVTLAAWLQRDMAMNSVEAMPWLREWNGRQADPLTDDELAKQLRDGMTYGKHAIGEALNSPAPARVRMQDDTDELAPVERADPIPLAEHYLAARHVEDGHLLLRRWRGDWWRWTGTHYLRVTDEAMTACTYRHLERCETFDGPRIVPVRPRPRMVADVLHALPSRGDVRLDETVEAPCWLDGRDQPDPAGLISCRNGLLDPETGTLLPPTPALFGTASLPFDFDPDPPPPWTWLDFLADLWPDDQESKDTLAELVGYWLTGDTRQHVITLMVGPKRSGKGTVARVLRELLGPAAVCGPTLSDLASHFGLEGLIGRRLAIVHDARLSGRTDQAMVVERLLSLSGEDALSVPRKHRPDWHGRIGARFLIATNELPRLADASGALASRFIVLRLTRSWLGHEDHRLTDRLLGELPGILGWALEGLHRLRARGRFIQPATSAEAIAELEELGSPIAAFLADRCVVDPAATIPCDELYAAWRNWCESAGREHPGPIHTFGRDLRATLPTLRTTQPRIGGSRIRQYEGLTLGLDVPT